MNPQQIIELFNEALARTSPAERSAFLDEACRDEPEARAQIEALLAAGHRAARDFLQQPLPGVPSPKIPIEQPGDRIGHYKLVEKIGEGGCGIVYLAEQESPVRRQVALKIIKLGMDTRAVIARFEAERQALAMMDHPNIAKVHDVGATETGRPYFVMELVRGVRITDYCDRQNLSTRERLGLFIQVCQAIQHAHQKGIIHRDIKPSNILVATPEVPRSRPGGHPLPEPGSAGIPAGALRLGGPAGRDAGAPKAPRSGSGVQGANVSGKSLNARRGEGCVEAPVPKVIDFGIAKATTDQRLTDKTVFTALEQFLGTPAYMSPEQARISGIDVDTRSDIYSLGVLLYELLTGRTPFDQKELLSAGLDEMRRIIREVEPVKPSTRLTQELNAQKVGRVAPRAPSSGENVTNSGAHGVTRPTDKSALHTPHSAFPSDLDWIVMKALEKDRTRRYETANGLATDIERHLNDEPVVARPPSRLYEFQKTVRRHKFGFAATGAVIVALALGLGFSTWTMTMERQARERAVHAESKSETVARFLKDILEGVGPSVALGRDAKTVFQELLDEASKRIGKELTNQPEVEVELRNVLGRTYGELGLFEQMEAMHRETLRLNRARFGEKHLEVAFSLEQLGRALRFQDKLKEAEPFIRQGLAMQLELAGTNSRALWFMNDLASLCEAQGNFPEAEENYRRALEGQRQSPADEVDSLITMMNLSGLYDKWGRYPDAEQLATNGLAMAESILPINHWRTFLAMSSLGEIYRHQGRYEEAERLQTNAVEGFSRVLSPDNYRTLAAMNNLAATMCEQERYAEAEPLMTNILAARQRVVGPEHDETLVSMQNLAMCYKGLRRYDRSEFHFTNALVISRRVNTSEYRNATIAINLSNLYASQGRFEEAEGLLTNSLPVARLWTPEQASRSLAFNTLIGIYAEQGRFVDAEPLQQEILDVEVDRDPKDTNALRKR